MLYGIYCLDKVYFRWYCMHTIYIIILIQETLIVEYISLCLQ